MSWVEHSASLQNPDKTAYACIPSVAGWRQILGEPIELKCWVLGLVGDSGLKN